MARTWRTYAAVAVIAVATVACGGAADDVNDPALPGAGAPTAGGSPSGVQATVAESPTDVGDDDDDGSDDADDADVTARNLAYEPAQVRVEAGDDLEVENADTTVDHTFTIEGEDIDEIVPAGDEIEVTLDLDPGTYTAICRFHDGMRVSVEIT
jgi:plastocyanin